MINAKTVMRGILVPGYFALLSACGGYGGGSSQTAASVALTAAPTSIVQGQAAVLTWSSNGASCMASGAWSGAQAASGTLSVLPTTVGNNTFTLTCTGGPYSSGTASATVAVTAASAFSKSNLVSSDAAIANTAQDPNLIDPWGMSFSAASTIWVADAGSQKSTLYDGTGIVQSLVVSIPAGVHGNPSPAGTVFNSTSTDFVVTSAGHSAGAVFIFAGEGGTISGWSPTVDATHAITAHDNPDGAVFKGLAIANNGTANRLYATDFHNNKVLVLDNTFTPVTVAGGFADASLPAGYAPFGIQTLQLQNQTRIVVTYAKQDAVAHDAVGGAGFGAVNIFDVNGVLVKHLVAAGSALNVPWGIALAPDNLGTLSGKLLIGSSGSGVINAYDPVTGDVAGTINDANGTPIATSGLKAIAFGNGAHNQLKTTLYFVAGINARAGGLYGRIDLGATAPDIIAPVVSITSPFAASTVSGVTPITVSATDNVGITQVEFFSGTTSLGVAATAPFTFSWNTATVANGAVKLTAQAKDAAGNLTVSAIIAATVNN